MGEFSLTHILLFAVIVLIFFGPSRIEGLGKSLGRSIRGFKDGLNEIDAEAKSVKEVKPEQVAARTDDSSESLKQTKKETQHS